MSLPFGLSSYLPPHEGWLPKWLFLVSAISVINSIQCYTSPSWAQRSYAGPLTKTKEEKPNDPSNPYPNSPVTPLSARTFGTWTFLSSIVRMYAAYHIDNPAVYQLAFATYLVAWGHFVSEWLVFGTARLGKGSALMGPLCVATGTAGWMWVQWEGYLG